MSVRDFGVSIIQGVRERAADQAALFLTLYNFSQYNEEVGIMMKENTEHCCCEGCDSREENTPSVSVSERHATCGEERRYRSGFRNF